MMFDKLCIYLIFHCFKIQTRRRYNNKRRPAIPGQVHKLKIDRTKNVYGKILIKKVFTQKFGDITEEDARKEGFPTLSKYKTYFKQINGEIDDNEIIWVVEFELIRGE